MKWEQHTKIAAIATAGAVLGGLAWYFLSRKQESNPNCKCVVYKCGADCRCGMEQSKKLVKNPNCKCVDCKCGDDCRCGKEEEKKKSFHNPKCTCGDKCQCGDNCRCGLDLPKEKFKCQCGDNCQCGDDCKCGGSIAAPPGIDDWKSISDDIYACSRLSEEAAAIISAKGFQSVVTLMLPSDSKFSTTVEEKLKAQKLTYGLCSVKSGPELDSAEVEAALAFLDKRSPGPVLVHCQSGARAIAVAVIHVALKHNLDDSQLEVLIKSSGLDQKPMRDWTVNYIKSHRK